MTIQNKCVVPLVVIGLFDRVRALDALKQAKMDKWLFRQNTRYKMEFGVHESAIRSLSPNGGESNLRYLSIQARKAIIQDNIECLRLMRSDRFKSLLESRRKEWNVFLCLK